MGYEIRMYFGKSELQREEIEEDLDHPFDDGSGFPYKTDSSGNYIRTGRLENWFKVFGFLDLCKLGYQTDALNDLIAESHETAREKWDKEFLYFYADDGNTKITKDCYDSPMWPVPVGKVLEALKKSHKKGSYRRTDWGRALLAELEKDPQGVEIIFYGH